MILRTRLLLPLTGGLVVFLLGLAALQAGDRHRTALIDEQSRLDAMQVVAGVQRRLLTIDEALGTVTLPLSAEEQRAEALQSGGVELWSFGNGVVGSTSALLLRDRGLQEQLRSIDRPGVHGPFTTSTGRDLVAIATRREDNWLLASLPADAMVDKPDTGALQPESLAIRWASGQQAGNGIFSASNSRRSRQESLEFPVPGGEWQLDLDSLAESRGGELRWALYIVVLLLSYLLALILHRLSIKPRTLLVELEQLDERYRTLNRDYSELLANREQIQDRIHQLTVTDNQTGMPNRQSFAEQLDKALTRLRSAPEAGPLCVAVAGLRDIETAEHTLGHSVISTVLPEVAARLKAALGDDYFVARISNYQLAILLPGHDQASAMQVAAQLVSSDITGIYEHADGKMNVAPRFGLAVAEDGYDYAERLIDQALSALTDAESGAVRWSLFESDSRDDRVTMIQLESDFRSAIDNNEFRLFYQPIVHTHSGKPKGFECLVRWQHPVEGLLPPARFIGLSESTGLITDLTRWELREAVRQAAAWENLEKLGCYLSINLSALDLLYAPLADELLALVKDAGLSPSTFRLEITESTLINNLAQARDMLTQLRDAGFGIMMDDFGTGFSSLSYLRQLPFSAVKIDRSFTQAITWDSKDYGMVRNILSLVHFLEMESIIEGVETTEQHELLLPLDPVYCQGYLFAKPMPAIDAEEYLAAATLNATATATGTHP